MRLSPYTALAKAAFKANLGRLDAPFKLTFCLTFWCNYRCQTCNIWKMKPRDELTLDEIRRFFQKSGKFLWVDLTGGEVTLRKDFIDICHAVIDGNPDLLLLHFPTNGYLTDKVVAAARSITTRRAGVRRSSSSRSRPMVTRRRTTRSAASRAAGAASSRPSASCAPCRGSRWCSA